MNDYFWELLSGIIASILAFVLGKKRGEAETQKLQLESLKLTQEVYDSLTKDINQRFFQLQEEITNLKSLVKEMENELEQCRKNVFTGSKKLNN